MDRQRQTKVALNEAAAREANQLLLSMQEPVQERVVVKCECSDPDCGRFLDIPPAALTDVRKHGARFLVHPDDSHCCPGAETVIEKRSGWWVVEKVGRGREVAEGTDSHGA